MQTVIACVITAVVALIIGIPIGIQIRKLSLIHISEPTRP